MDKLMKRTTKNILPRFKRNDKILLFGSANGNTFRGDSKVVYLYMHEHRKELGLKHVYFVTRDELLYKQLKKAKYEVVYAGSSASKKAHLKSKYIFSSGNPSDVESTLTNGAWKVFFFPRLPKNKDELAFAYSDGHKKFLMKKYGLTARQIYISPAKRATYFSQDASVFFTEEEKKFADKLFEMKLSGIKFAGYFPAHDPDTSYTSDCAKSTFEMAEKLKNKKIAVITKQYLPAAGKCYSEEEGDNVINLPFRYDTSNFLPFIDVMVTDYAFTTKDYLLLNKAVLFFPLKPGLKNAEYDFKKASEADVFTDADALCERIYDIIQGKSYNDNKTEQRKKMIKTLYPEL